MYKIKQVNRFLVDVFHGDGWDNCARLRKEGNSWKVMRTWGRVSKTVLTDIGGSLK